METPQEVQVEKKASGKAFEPNIPVSQPIVKSEEMLLPKRNSESEEEIVPEIVKAKQAVNKRKGEKGEKLSKKKFVPIGKVNETNKSSKNEDLDYTKKTFNLSVNHAVYFNKLKSAYRMKHNPDIDERELLELIIEEFGKKLKVEFNK